MTWNRYKYYGKYYWMYAVCNNPNHVDYHRYGAKGIACYWQLGEYHDFESWLIDTLGHKPSPYHRLGRKDKAADFTPRNLQWELHEDRANNYCRNVFVKYNGRKQSIKRWADELKVPYYTLRRRINAGKTIKQIKREFSA